MSGGFQLRFKSPSPSFDWDIAEWLKISTDWKQVKQLQHPIIQILEHSILGACVYLWKLGKRKKSLPATKAPMLGLHLVILKVFTGV